MIENLARVAERQGAWVVLTAASATGCAKCDAGEGCGGGVFGKLINRRLSGLRLRDDALNLQPGEHVVVGLPDGMLLRLTLLLYGLPLVALLLFAAAATALGWSDLMVAGAGGIGLFAGLYLAPFIRLGDNDDASTPCLLRRASSGLGSGAIHCS